MVDGHEGFDIEDNGNSNGGGSFVIGLLTGTVLGAGLGLLFAPKAGSEIRSQLSEQASQLANTAAEGRRRATETAGDLANLGREMYGRARDAVTRGTDEAQRYARDVADDVAGKSRG
jgi:gas vesicle protein